jgi:hypothetical protein
MFHQTNMMTANQNKKMLWDLLITKIYDTNFDYDKFRNHLDDTYDFYTKKTNNAHKNNSMNDINKSILENCFNYIQSSNVIKGRNVIKTNNKLSNEDAFNKKLREKKESYDGFLTSSNPAELDFSEKIDEPISNENIGRIVKEEIAERNSSIKKISKNYVKNDDVKKWLNNDKKYTDAKNNKNIAKGIVESDENINMLKEILENQKIIIELLKNNQNP